VFVILVRAGPAISKLGPARPLVFTLYGEGEEGQAADPGRSRIRDKKKKKKKKNKKKKTKKKKNHMAWSALAARWLRQWFMMREPRIGG